METNLNTENNSVSAENVQQNAETVESNTLFCENCGAAVSPGQTFCADCGAPVSYASANKCVHCGTPLEDGQSFCPACGYKTESLVTPDVAAAIDRINQSAAAPKKSKTGLIIALSIIAVAVILGGIIFSYVMRLQRIEQYKADAKQFYMDVIDSGSKMEKIGNEIQSNWKTYIYNNGYYYKKYSSVDDAVAKAQSAQSSNVSSVKNSKPRITSAYNKLKKAPSDDTEDIAEAVKEVYDKYEDMYECVINVSGNYNTYTSKFSECDDKLSDALKKLDREL